MSIVLYEQFLLTRHMIGHGNGLHTHFPIQFSLPQHMRTNLIFYLGCTQKKSGIEHISLVGPLPGPGRKYRQFLLTSSQELLPTSLSQRGIKRQNLSRTGKISHIIFSGQTGFQMPIPFGIADDAPMHIIADKTLYRTLGGSKNQVVILHQHATAFYPFKNIPPINGSQIISREKIVTESFFPIEVIFF